MSQESTKNRLKNLQDRGQMLKAARDFFYAKGLLEVDCPILTEFAALDSNIDLITTTCGKFLHSSPEYGMKRLLSEGIGDIFQISHVFRKGEEGSRHNPEFTMAEWYRLNFSLENLIGETIEFISLFIGNLPINRITYRQAFLKYADFDPKKVDEKLLCSHLKKHDFEFEGMEKADFDTLLQFAAAVWIEPSLDPEAITLITHFPATQAALSEKCLEDGFQAAKRFEAFARGIELANGYQELLCPEEIESRFILENSERKKKGLQALPYDLKLIEALKKGLPKSSGVAVGFDRLMMLKNKASHIGEILPFSWTNA